VKDSRSASEIESERECEETVSLPQTKHVRCISENDSCMRHPCSSSHSMQRVRFSVPTLIGVPLFKCRESHLHSRYLRVCRVATAQTHKTNKSRTQHPAGEATHHHLAGKMRILISRNRLKKKSKKHLNSIDLFQHKHRNHAPIYCINIPSHPQKQLSFASKNVIC
jgi:hypothetical protein